MLLRVSCPDLSRVPFKCYFFAHAAAVVEIFYLNSTLNFGILPVLTGISDMNSAEAFNKMLAFHCYVNMHKPKTMTIQLF